MGNTQIYDTGALYEQHMDDKAQRDFMAFYRELLKGLPIHTIHDCSIGAGGSTLPLAKLGYTVSGSDLNENLLKRAELNFRRHGMEATLFLSDLREIDRTLPHKVDCMISTGNSLPHVDRQGFRQFLGAARDAIQDGGYLFFDLRNWDTIVREHPVMHAIDPKVMTQEEHRSVYLLFHWHDDGSVSFIFATCTDKNGKHVGIDLIEAPVYYPLCRDQVEEDLAAAGYRILSFADMDEVWLSAGTDARKTGDFHRDFAEIQWYGVLAQKI